MKGPPHGAPYQPDNAVLRAHNKTLAFGLTRQGDHPEDPGACLSPLALCDVALVQIRWQCTNSKPPNCRAFRGHKADQPARPPITASWRLFPHLDHVRSLARKRRNTLEDGEWHKILAGWALQAEEIVGKPDFCPQGQDRHNGMAMMRLK